MNALPGNWSYRHYLWAEMISFRQGRGSYRMRGEIQLATDGSCVSSIPVASIKGE